MIMALVERNKMNLHDKAALEYAAAQAIEHGLSIEDLMNAMVELGDLFAEQDDALVELAELIAEG